MRTDTSSSLHEAAHLTCMGNYHEAAKAVGDRWPGIGVIPARNGDSDEAYARLLMICGVLTMKMGNARQSSVQGVAKDMLTQSARLFGEHFEKQAAMLWLAEVYCLCGEYKESLSVIETVLLSGPDVEGLFGATMIQAADETGLGLDAKSLESLEGLVGLVGAVPPMTKGKFHAARGNSYHNIGRMSEALADYRTASDIFEEYSAVRWEAMNSNNIAGLYRDLEQFILAHNYSERAISLFRTLGDKAHEGKAWDQDAKTYLKEEKFVPAERHSRKAVELLTGDNHSWRAEALITHGVAAMYAACRESVAELQEAIKLCEFVGDVKQAEHAYAELWKSLRLARQSSFDIGNAVDPVEHIIIERTLARHGGKVSAVAEELHLNRNALNRKIERMKLTRQPKRTRVSRSN